MFVDGLLQVIITCPRCLVFVFNYFQEIAVSELLDNQILRFFGDVPGLVSPRGYILTKHISLPD